MDEVNGIDGKGGNVDELVWRWMRGQNKVGTPCLPGGTAEAAGDGWSKDGADDDKAGKSGNITRTSPLPNQDFRRIFHLSITRISKLGLRTAP